MYPWSFIYLAIVKYAILFIIIYFVIQWQNKNICNVKIKIKVKCSRYRPDVAQRVGRGTALLFHDRGTRRWWVVSSTPQTHFPPGKDPVPILQEAGWAPGPVWTGEKSRPHRESIPDLPARSQSIYRLSYPVNIMLKWLLYLVISVLERVQTLDV